MIDPVFFAVAAAAMLIVGLSKAGLLGGLGVIGVPLLTLYMPARDAAGMMLPILLCMDAVAVWMYRKEFSWQLLKIMLPGAMFGTLLGWLLWAFVSDAVVILIVGIVTLLFVLDALLPLRKKLEGLPPSTGWGRFWGAIAGFTSFISHTGGPPFQIYALPQKLTPAIYAGTSAVFFAIVNTSKLIPYFFLGQLNVSNLQLAALFAPIGMLGVLVGVILVRKISAKHFYTIAYWLIFLLSFKLIWDGVTGIMAGL